MNKVLIDNCVVSKIDNDGVCIRSINLEIKLNKNVNINDIKKISFGDKKKDNKIIRKLCDGVLNFDEVCKLVI